MEGLIFCAKNSINHPSVAFQDGPSSSCLSSGKDTKTDVLLETIEIQQGVYERQRRDAHALCRFYAEPHLNEIVPRLKLVSIPENSLSFLRTGSSTSVSLDITKRLFDNLFEQLQANPWVLWLISNDYDGYHYLPAHNEYADTYFFGSSSGAVVWTFLPATAHTKVLLIDRSKSSQERFYALLHSYTPHLSTPYVPLVAIAVGTMLGYDQRLDRYLNNIERIEVSTGFINDHTPGILAEDSGFDVDALTTWSRESSSTQINIGDLLRHHDNCMRALDTIRDDVHTIGISEDVNARYKDDYNRSIANLLDAIRVLRMREESFKTYAIYLKNRAEAQISVVRSPPPNKAL